MDKSNIDRAIALLEIYNTKILERTKLVTNTKTRFKYINCVTAYRINLKDQEIMRKLGFKTSMQWNGFYYWGFSDA